MSKRYLSQLNKFSSEPRPDVQSPEVSIKEPIPAPASVPPNTIANIRNVISNFLGKKD